MSVAQGGPRWGECALDRYCAQWGCLEGPQGRSSHAVYRCLVLALHPPLAPPGQLRRIKHRALDDRHLKISRRTRRDPVPYRKPADPGLSLPGQINAPPPALPEGQSRVKPHSQPPGLKESLPVDALMFASSKLGNSFLVMPIRVLRVQFCTTAPYAF